MEASKGPARGLARGMTDEVLWAVNPKLVIVHVSGFGQTGDPKMVNARGLRSDGVWPMPGYIYAERYRAS